MPTSELEAQMQKRIRASGLALAFVFLVLAGRLWYVQIAQGDRYREESESNRTRVIRAMAPRGQLLDRKGRVLATSRPQISVCVIPSELVKPDETLNRLAGILGITRQELDATIEERSHSGYPRYLPIKVAADVPIEIISQVKEQQLMLPGVELEVNPVRVYPEGLGAHVLGYLSEANEDELSLLKDYGYRQGDYVGKAGIERELNIPLRGVDGGQLVEVDASGRMTRFMGYRAPVPGETVTLTIDRDVQKAAEQGLAGKVGAAVAIDPRNGEILAMAAGPTFDANAFARGIKKKEWQQTMLDPRHPLQNRAIANKYPPGSTFKIITALAGLQSGAITDSSSAYCSGAFYLGHARFRCWGRHGSVQLLKAIEQSCDVFFYTYGLKMGPDAITGMARAFGLGKKTGIALEAEKMGNIPRPMKERNGKGERWYPGQTVNMSIGQGVILATPLQMAEVIAGAANWGTIYQPHFIKKIVDPHGKPEAGYSAIRYEKGEDGKSVATVKDGLGWAPHVNAKVPASRANFAKVREGLRRVVTSGTGKIVNLPNIAVAGKTGSAENPHGRTHAWFVCFAPFDKPTIAICTFVENGGHGGSAAGPIARRMLEAYFHLKSSDKVDAGRTD